jgi:hypothetical protein
MTAISIARKPRYETTLMSQWYPGQHCAKCSDRLLAGEIARTDGVHCLACFNTFPKACPCCGRAPFVPAERGMIGRTGRCSRCWLDEEGQRP